MFINLRLNAENNRDTFSCLIALQSFSQDVINDISKMIGMGFNIIYVSYCTEVAL